MRRILTLLGLLTLGCPALKGENLSSDESPLYLRFRVLSGLPWKEARVTRKSILGRIFQEPNMLARGEVLREYLHTALPVEEFAAAFDECMALEQADFPEATAEFVMQAWAERDPAAAIHRCQTLFDLVIEGAPLGFDQWKTPIRFGNLEKARASSYWFGSRGVVHACWKGLAAAPLPQESRKELEKIYREAYAQRFQEAPPIEVEDPYHAWARRHHFSEVANETWPSSNAKMREEFIRVLAASPDEVSGMIKWPDDPSTDIMLPRALVRWMNGDAKKAPKIAERIMDAYDPRRFYHEEIVPFPAEFLVEWAMLDREGLMAWGASHSPWPRLQAVDLAVRPNQNEDQVYLAAQSWHRNGPGSDFDKLWITLDPDTAIRCESRYGDTYNIDAVLEDLWRSDPPANYWRSAIGAYARRGFYGGGNEAWGITSVSARIDFRAMVKQYGLWWCLRSGEYKRSQVPLMFSNRVALENGEGLHDTLSALRTWALLRPKEMRAWIEGETFTPDLREALVWLLDNAVGGFGL